jgi:hypothetical protein
VPQAAAAALPKAAFDEGAAEPYEDHCGSASEAGEDETAAATGECDTVSMMPPHLRAAAAAAASARQADEAAHSAAAAAAAQRGCSSHEVSSSGEESFSLKPHVALNSSSTSRSRGLSADEQSGPSSTNSVVNFPMTHLTSSSSSSGYGGDGADTPHLSLPSPHGSYMSYHHQKLSGQYGNLSTDDASTADDSPCSFAEQQQQHQQQQQQYEDDPFGTFHFRLPPIRTKSNPNSAPHSLTNTNTAGLTTQGPQPEAAHLMRTSNGGSAAAAAAAAESDRLAAAAAATVRASKPLSRAGSIVASVASTLSRITTGRSVSAGGALKSSSNMYGQPQQPSEETTLLNPLFSPSSQGSIQSSPGQLSSGAGSAAAAAAGSFAGSRPDQMLRHRLSQSSAWVGTTSSGEAGSTSLGLGLGTTSSTAADGQIAAIKAGRSGSGVNPGALWMFPNAGKDGISGSIMQQEKAYLSGTIPAAQGTTAYMAAGSTGKHGCTHKGTLRRAYVHVFDGQKLDRYLRFMWLHVTKLQGSGLLILMSAYAPDVCLLIIILYMISCYLRLMAQLHYQSTCNHSTL